MAIAILVLIKTAVAVLGIGIATLVSLISILPLSYAWTCMNDAFTKTSTKQDLPPTEEERALVQALCAAILAAILVLVACLIWIASVGVLVLTCIVLLIFP